jgi:manganese-transporting P-type ATPase
LGTLNLHIYRLLCQYGVYPELNTKLRLVPFSTPSKTYLTVLMVADYCGYWVVEQIFKRAFSDFRPKDIALRRPGQFESEEKTRAGRTS